MSEFKIGDRVVCLTDYPDDNEDIRIGSTGTVCRVTPEEDCGDVGVCWDIKVEGEEQQYEPTSNPRAPWD